jgi:protein TonB
VPCPDDLRPTSDLDVAAKPSPPPPDVSVAVADHRGQDDEPLPVADSGSSPSPAPERKTAAPSAFASRWLLVVPAVGVASTLFMMPRGRPREPATSVPMTTMDLAMPTASTPLVDASAVATPSGAPPTPVPPVPGALVEASDPELVRPVCTACPPPPLPLIAEDPRYLRSLGKTGGLVELRVLVDESGEVKETAIVRGDKALADAAVKAVRRWKYTSARKQGVAVKVWLIVPIHFALPPSR